jgi:DNA (cytosine-5)-methyltransferase 1
MKTIVFDLFCGTGGFAYGFGLACPGGVETRLGIDILEASLRTFAANHVQAAVLRSDIRRLSCEDIADRTGMKRGDVDIVIGGPPCQGFSSIRPFRSSNHDDPRNTLFEQFANIVNYFRPRALVMENVVGLATHKGGETIGQIVECFSDIGYECDWRIMNAAHFGVPQRRERLVLIGVEKGLPLQFPSPTHDSNGSTIGHRDRTRMLLPLDLPLFQREEVLEPAVTVMDAISDLPPLKAGQAATTYDRLPSNDYQAARRNGADVLTLHEATAHTPRMLEIIRHSGPNVYSIPKHLISSGFSSCYSRLDADTPSVTITVNFVHPASNRCVHPVQDRALTPREGARLQSFDDTFVFVGSRTQIVKQIGNAVPPLLGRAIGAAVLSCLGVLSSGK